MKTPPYALLMLVLSHAAVAADRKDDPNRVLPLPEKVIDADISNTLSEAPSQFKTFGSFRTVADNPPERKGSFFTVVVVAGNPDERESWARSARAEYGKNVFIYNDAFNINDLAAILGRFPKASVKTLILGGHPGSENGCKGIHMGRHESSPGAIVPDKYYHPKGGATENINAENFARMQSGTLVHEKDRKIIRESLAHEARVEFQSCHAGDTLGNIRALADVFQATVYAATGYVGEWRRISGSGVWQSNVPGQPSYRERAEIQTLNKLREEAAQQLR